MTTASMMYARWGHTATLLGNGKVLVAGGETNPYPASAELYDPGTNTWTAAGWMITARSAHTATLLGNGKVLVAGGNGLASAELYDPGSNTWMMTGSMMNGREEHTATLLGNGEVLVAGGYVQNSGYLASAELYDPVASTWTSAGSLMDARRAHTATLLGNGTVLVAGGAPSLASAELYAPMPVPCALPTDCGAAQVCSSGMCVFGCIINSIFYPPNAINPSNACQLCAPAASTTAWSNQTDGTSCGAAQVCSSGACVSGSSSSSASSGGASSGGASSGGATGSGGAAGTGRGSGGSMGPGGDEQPVVIRGCAGCSVERDPAEGASWVGLGILLTLRRRRRPLTAGWASRRSR
jgi:MYXO-CTERM domain-containing protein